MVWFGEKLFCAYDVSLLKYTEYVNNHTFVSDKYPIRPALPETKEEVDKEINKVPQAPIGIINNLAREKFGRGLPKSPKKTNLRRPKQVIIPRVNKVQRERAERSRRMREEQEERESNPVAPAADIGETMIGGWDDHVIPQSSRSIDEDRPLPTTLKPRQRVVKGEATLLDMDEGELAQILRCRTSGVMTKSKLLLPMSRSSKSESAAVMAQLSVKLSDEIVGEVCAELSEPKLLSRLLHQEFVM